MDTMKGLESVIRMGRILMEKEKGTMTPTEIIACDGLVEAWKPGAYVKDDIRTHAGQTWRCAQPHDSGSNPGWEPGKVPALWVPYHTKDPKAARPYIAPTMAEDAYNKDECMLYTDGKVYRAKQDAVVWAPDVQPNVWEEVKLGV